MRLRHIGLVSAAVFAAVIVSGTSTAATSAQEGTLRATVTDLDARGRVIGSPRQAAEGRRVRSLQASGCREIDIVKEGSGFLFGTTVYKWHHSKRWCWANGRVTGVWSSAYATNVDANWYYRGLAGSAGYFYGANQSGHYSFRQAKMENCVLKYGCIGSEYPWVKIWAEGNGSYRWQRGS
jgi:hypothetical protein